MSYHARRASAVSTLTQRIGNTRIGRKLKRSDYVTMETVVMWLSYIFLILGSIIVEAGQIGISSEVITYSMFVWFAPASYAFLIWPVIYIALGLWLVMYTRRAALHRGRLSATAILFMASSILNILWLVVWHLQFIGFSVIVIVALWIVLASWYLSLKRTVQAVWEWAPVSLYTAWTTVAVLANLAVWITRSFGGGIAFLDGFIVLLLTVGILALGFIMQRNFNDSVFALVFLWALIAIGVHVSEVSWFIAMLVYALCFVAAIVMFVPFQRMHEYLQKQ